jgi:hypothetical protein
MKKKAEASRIRSKVNWYEKGEKSTKYFFNLASTKPSTHDSCQAQYQPQQNDPPMTHVKLNINLNKTIHP